MSDLKEYLDLKSDVEKLEETRSVLGNLVINHEESKIDAINCIDILGQLLGHTLTKIRNLEEKANE